MEKNLRGFMGKEVGCGWAYLHAGSRVFSSWRKQYLASRLLRQGDIHQQPCELYARSFCGPHLHLLHNETMCDNNGFTGHGRDTMGKCLGNGSGEVLDKVQMAVARAVNEESGDR